MELILKAYKCSLPKFFDIEYSTKEELFSDERNYNIIYGHNQKDAVKNFCLSDEDYSYWELKSNIITKRFKNGDLYKSKISKKLMNLSESQIKCLTHSLGVQIGDILPKEFYRNYSFYYDKNDICESLVENGFMGNYQKNGSEIYYVSDIGIEQVKTLLLNCK